jgi:hypothetical protein
MATKIERIAQNLEIAAAENRHLGLPKPFMLNGIWLVPLGDGRFKPVGLAQWRRPRAKLRKGIADGQQQ